MQAEQPQPENLLLVHEMADVGPAEAGTGGARAAVLQRTLVPGEAGIGQIEPALARQGAACARGAGGQDAVEHVDAARDDLYHALRVADPHEVARLLPGQECRGLVWRVEHRLPAVPPPEPPQPAALHTHAPH